MAYKDALWDGSDPSYAPGLSKGRQYYYWKPSPKFRKMGYPKTSIRLTGEEGDGQDLLRAHEARELTRQMLAYYGANIETLEPGTWGWLIHRYKTDRHSPIHGVKENTRTNYIWILDRWDAAIGRVAIGATDYTTICDLRDGMKAKGRNTSYIHRMFERLRAVAKYGKMLKLRSGARGIGHTPRHAVSDPAPTLGHADARANSGRCGRGRRQGHVRLRDRVADPVGLLPALCRRSGPVAPCAPDAGGIVRKLSRNRRQRLLPDAYERWQDGLTWDMFDEDLSGFSKVISKTARSMPDPIRFGLTDVPELRARLFILSQRGRIGPVITGERTGMPYTVYGWSQAFRRIRDDLGLPKNLTVMDTRAGALTEAKNLGADPYILRDAGQHLNVTTTDRYARGRDESIAKVVKLRNTQ